MTLAVNMESERTPNQTPATYGMIGDSEPMRRLRALIETVAPTRLPVLIYGPTGSGKELVANALHVLSRRTGAFVPFNACAISETMFEDALFGHVRGAFTGALNDMPGFLREANGGTVFLDEITGLPPMLQAKLLRAIETGVFRPVGAKRDAQSDFRVVTATNERLEELVGEGRFREDFAHRIGAVTVRVPALADRREDIPLLVRHFLAAIGSAHVCVADSVIGELQEHHWPGNVRELRQVVEWSAAFSNGHLTQETARQAIEQRSSRPAIHAEAAALARKELRAALERCGWNVDQLAAEIGVHRATLYRRIKRLGLASLASTQPT